MDWSPIVNSTRAIFTERLYDDKPPQFPAIFLASNLAPIGARKLTRKMAEISISQKI